MMNKKNGLPKRCLLVDIKKHQAFPFSSAGFQTIDRPIREVMNDLSGTIFIFNDGKIDKVAKIEFVNNGPLSEFFVFLRRPVQVRVTFEVCTMSFSDVRYAALHGILWYREEFRDNQESWLFSLKEASEIEAIVLSATNAVDLINFIDLPAVDDCLDIL